MLPSSRRNDAPNVFNLTHSFQSVIPPEVAATSAIIQHEIHTSLPSTGVVQLPTSSTSCSPNIAMFRKLLLAPTNRLIIRSTMLGKVRYLHRLRNRLRAPHPIPLHFLTSDEPKATTSFTVVQVSTGLAAMRCDAMQCNAMVCSRVAQTRALDLHWRR